VSAPGDAFGELRALCQRADEPFAQVCALLDAWGDTAELERVALPYAVDHVRRWSTPRPAPLRWRARLVRGEPCPELAVCDTLDLRFVRDLIVPPTHTELADRLSSADALSGITHCRVDLLEPGWADAMPRLTHLSLHGRAGEDGRPLPLSRFAEGLPGVAHVELHGVSITERDVHALDANAPGGALEGFALGRAERADLDGALDWLCARAPHLRALELHGHTINGGLLDPQAIGAIVEALDAHEGAIRLETLGLSMMSTGARPPVVRFDERWGRLRRLALALPETISEPALNALTHSKHLGNLEALRLPRMRERVWERLLSEGPLGELERLHINPNGRAEAPLERWLAGPGVRETRDLVIDGYRPFSTLNALAQNRHAGALRALEVVIARNLEPHQWNELFAGPGLGRVESLSVSGTFDDDTIGGVLGALGRNLALPSLRELEIATASFEPLAIDRETQIHTISLLECDNGGPRPIGPRIGGALRQTLRRLEVPEEWSLPQHVDTMLAACPNLEVLVTEGTVGELDAAALAALDAAHRDAGVVGLRRAVTFGHGERALLFGRSRSRFEWSELDPP
jgi:hypothetical protein